MENETERLNRMAADAIRDQEYTKAVRLVAQGSGDLHLLALLSIARELSYLSDRVEASGEWVSSAVGRK